MSNLSITTKTDNKTRSDVAANKKIPASEINEMVSWMNSPMSNLGTFSSTVDFSTQGYYTARTLSGDETWNFSNIVAGVVQYNKITVSGSETISAGTNGRVINGNLGTLSAGTYDIWFASPTGTEVLISVPGVSTASAPTLTSLTVENVTPSVVDAVFDEAVTITTAGWSIATDGAALSISSIASGSGTSTPKFQLSRSIVEGETVTMSYNSSTGNTISTASGIELADITNQAVTVSVSWAPSDLGSALIAEWNAKTSTVGNPNVTSLTDTGTTGSFDLTAVGAPQFNGTDTIAFDGTDDALQADAAAETFRSAAGTTGEIVMLIARTDGTANARPLAAGVASLSTQYNNTLHRNSAGGSTIEYSFGGQTVKTVTAFDDANFHRIMISSTGTAYKIVVDNVDETLAFSGGGSNNGSWFADWAGPFTHLGLFTEILSSTRYYYKGSLKYMSIINRQLTTEERGNYDTWLQNF